MNYTAYTFRAQGLAEGVQVEDVYDLLAASLADLGFDSFDNQGDLGLLAYIPTEAIDPKGIEEAVHTQPWEGVTFAYTSETMPEVNWNEEWEKNYFQPIVFGDNLCIVRAPFHTPDPSVKMEIIINPKMAFGTGNHETTSLMIHYLTEQRLEGKRVLDMGSGTGILGILALKQGADHLTAIDIDRWAYENIIENAQLNSVYIAEALQGDASSLQGKGPFDLVLANITRNILLADLPAYEAVMAKGARIVLSGFYEEDAPLLIERGAALGLSFVQQRMRNKWALVELRKD